tara:strand:+ start:850 stop:1689 length:840 start_codon:yes stop_codon:yes gene_type:complete
MPQLSQPKTIALLTDFGYSDPYVSIMKSVLINNCPETRILDISHGIKRGDITQAAYTLEFVLPYLPAVCVVVAVIDPGVGSSRRPILIKSGPKTYIGPDNGVFSRVTQNSNVECTFYHLTQRDYWMNTISNTFHGRDVFAPVAAHYANGVEANLLGEKTSQIHEIAFEEAVIQSNNIIDATIIYEDSFGNLITNIPQDWLDEATQILQVRSNATETAGWCANIPVVSSYQHDVEVVGVIGSAGYLEFAAPNSNCSAVTGLSTGDKISVHKIDHGSNLIE